MSTPRICIVAVDKSQDSEFALDWYIKNLYKTGDQVVLVYVPEGHGLLHASKWENTVYSLNRDIMTGVSLDEQKQIVEVMSRFARKLRRLRIEGRVRNIMALKPEDGILRAADEENAEMIVVGCRGRGALHRTFGGSVSDYLVHHAPCPVVVCKRQHKSNFRFLLCTSAA
ncbi:hypothetical protein BsWGS_11243 [Bradybaena similaris]